MKEVEIIVREPEDELARRRKRIVSDVQREDVGPVELAEALHARLTEDPTVKTQPPFPIRPRLTGPRLGES